jgi:hypothetical protein
VFVVFQSPATKSTVVLPGKTEKEITVVEGSWSIAFQPNRGASTGATFEKLTSYTENPDTGIKYFSGTATYTKTVNIGSNLIEKDSKTWLDLGEVKNLAEVVVNGKSLGIVWKKPFRVDVTGDIKAGKNKLEIKVTNLWVNRLIGDQQPDAKQKITYTAIPFYKANSKLQPSGLLGPVKLISVQ